MFDDYIIISSYIIFTHTGFSITISIFASSDLHVDFTWFRLSGSGGCDGLSLCSELCPNDLLARNVWLFYGISETGVQCSRSGRLDNEAKNKGKVGAFCHCFKGRSQGENFRMLSVIHWYTHIVSCNDASKSKHALKHTIPRIKPRGTISVILQNRWPVTCPGHDFGFQSRQSFWTDAKRLHGWHVLHHHGGRKCGKSLRFPYCWLANCRWTRKYCGIPGHRHFRGSCFFLFKPSFFRGHQITHFGGHQTLHIYGNIERCLF